MTSAGVSTLFSRILLVIGGLLVLGLSYWFIQTSLAPVPVPPVPPRQSAVRFDPKLDVSKNTVFFNLKQLGPDATEPTDVGRPNPFVPVTSPVPLVVPTSTVSVTSTMNAVPATSALP